MGELRSQKQQREQLVASLRAEGKSWVEVAGALRQHYRFNARVAFRYAHGWSQREAADEWNKRWPDELKTFKMFSYWEMWPSSTGHAPTFDNLGKLAELYECAVSDLLVDLPDFRYLDVAGGMQTTALTVPGPDVELVVPSDVAVWVTATGFQLPDKFVTLLMQYLGSLLAPSDRERITPRDRDRAYHQLVQFLRSWAHTMDRRDVLRLLAWAATTALTIDLEEQERVASVLSKPSRVDTTTIDHIEAVLWRCQRQDDALGPQAALDTVLAQRNLARFLARECPASFRPRLLSVLSNASRHAGWLCFDLNDFESARYYYEDARALAHEAENTELGAFVLCNMSHLATWQRKPRIGIDHAVAAGEWAKRTDDVLLQAYAADVAARAYATDGQPEPCLAALDAAGTTLAMTGDQQPGYVYFYNDGQYSSTCCLCHLELHEPQRAVAYAEQSLKTIDQSYARNVAIVTVNLGIAHMQSNELDEAARLLGDAGEIAACNSSARLVGQLKQARAGMQPWQHTAAVRTLDERLAAYGLA
jgi:tetratricopeptide (TPR) repeat protein